ncbi:MAG: phosphoglucomutase (alpha-D-glucose-1,6-bisphosphate-dependent) [Lentisphaeria bacterium]|nr:phosphoglucomutase (alpha-D-glucose-1,6-bisphosphate-dependent) [Lentisphaeria bacterium]
MPHISPLAGKPVPPELLIDPASLVGDYYAIRPDPTNGAQTVVFGTSGHRGCASVGSFNENHILAMTQAICETRAAHGVTGPLFIGMDTHALSLPAHKTALQVLAANGVDVRRAAGDQFTPTPVISHAILAHNRTHGSKADGIIVTPSHNPPGDGGFKYNPPTGGPADKDLTEIVAQRANELLTEDNRGVKTVPYEQALESECVAEHDYITPYVDDLPQVIDIEAIRDAKLRLGADALGGAGLAFWDAIAQRHGLDITPINATHDPTFRFMHVDHDGKVRMDCSSAFAMAGLIQLKDHFDIAFGNDPDFDRHGIVTPVGGLMNPNHYLAVAIQYLFTHRPGWNAQVGIGKTLVSSSMIDRVAESIGRPLIEVPVGFKWFVDGLLSGTLGFGGEESAGASFLRHDGTVWTTDKDGIVLALLAAEITAVTGKDPHAHYAKLTSRFGEPVYQRRDVPATTEQKNILKSLSPDQVKADTLAGEPILEKLTRAPGNGADVGGLKVVTKNGWFAARPSGTEEIYKIYAESFLGADHLNVLQQAAQELVDSVFQTR